MDRRRLRSLVLAAALLVPGGTLAADEGRAVLRSVEGTEVGTVTLRQAAFGGLILMRFSAATPAPP